MAKKIAQSNNYKCDECSNAKWILEAWNLDLKGSPICYECSHINKQHGKRKALVRGSRACELFKRKRG